MNLKIELLRMDGGTQPRAEISEETVKEYAESMTDGAEFPPVIVFYDGTEYWLADGFHRANAAYKVGRDEVATDIRQGTLRDAVLYSVSANASHGLRRTNADKRRAVMTLLGDSEWSAWSDGEIARRCGVTRQTVSNTRPHSQNLPVTDQATYTTKHGTVATMNTANIGRKPEPVMATPGQIAEAIGDPNYGIEVAPSEQAAPRVETITTTPIKTEQVTIPKPIKPFSQDPWDNANHVMHDLIGIRPHFDLEDWGKAIDSAIQALRMVLENKTA